MLWGLREAWEAAHVFGKRDLGITLCAQSSGELKSKGQAVLRILAVSQVHAASPHGAQDGHRAKKPVSMMLDPPDQNQGPSYLVGNVTRMSNLMSENEDMRSARGQTL